MEFGALANPKLMDRPEFQARMRMPEDCEHTRQRLEWLGEQDAKRAAQPQPQPRHQPKLLAGCPVWNHPTWIGKVYPPKTPAKESLKYYSQQFHAIELNTTFYGTPEEETLLRWKADAEAGSAQANHSFTFCPKLPKILSHDQMLQNARAATHHFIQRMRRLGDTLGPCWLQLPPSFTPHHLGLLDRWLAEDWGPSAQAEKPALKLAIEFRHPDWFFANESERTLIPEATRLLEAHGCAAVITDTPGRRDVLHTTLTASWTFIRYTGNQRHPFDQTRLESWAQRLDRWFEKGLKGALFFVHEPGEEHIPDTVNDWVSIFNRIGNRVGTNYGIQLNPWKPFVDPAQTASQLNLL